MTLFCVRLALTGIDMGLVKLKPLTLLELSIFFFHILSYFEKKVLESNSLASVFVFFSIFTLKRLKRPMNFPKNVENTTLDDMLKYFLTLGLSR